MVFKGQDEMRRRMNDLISRADTAEAITKEYQWFEKEFAVDEDDEEYGHFIGHYGGLSRAKRIVKSMPSVSAEPKEKLIKAFADNLTAEEIAKGEEYAKGYADGLKEQLSADSDLISRADAKKQISEWATIITKPTHLDKEATMLVLDEIPSVSAERSADDYVRIEVYRDLYEKYIELKHNAERVIRCKDCEYYEHESYCRATDGKELEPMDFCSRAKMKGGYTSEGD